MEKPLSPMEKWMVRSNLTRLRAGESKMPELVALLRHNGYPRIAAAVETSWAKERLEYLRGELRAERVSYGDLDELQSLAAYIEPGDVELLEPAGVPEFPN